jgi:hypothetical protein
VVVAGDVVSVGIGVVVGVTVGPGVGVGVHPPTTVAARAATSRPVSRRFILIVPLAT